MWDVAIQCPRRKQRIIGERCSVPGARYVPGPAARDSTKEYALLDLLINQF